MLQLFQVEAFLCCLFGLFYIAFSLSVGNVADLSFTVNISESSKPGKEVFNFQYTFGNNATSFSILSGNEDHRFKMWPDGILVTNGFLDRNLDIQYKLIISFISSPWNFDTALEHDVTLTIILEDEIDWPPFYNSTCETPVYTGLPTNLNGYVILDVLLGEERQHGSRFRFRNLILEANTDNARCSIHLIIKISDPRRTASDYVLKFDQVAGPFIPVPKTIAYEDRETFPKNFSQDASLESYSIMEVIFEEFSTSAPVVWKTSATRQSYDVGFYTMKVEFVTQGCPSGRYGFFCDKDCICQNGATCHGFNGACKCSKGWTGPACDIALKEISVTPIRSEASYGQRVYLFCQYNNVKIVSLYGMRWTFFDASSNRTLTNHLDEIIYEIDNSRLTIFHFVDERAGTYQCSVTDKDGVEYSAEATVTLSGCIDNFYGDFCNMTCDCKEAIKCDRSIGCVCHGGWIGKWCDLDVQAPNITDCPVDQTVLAEDDENSATVSWMNPTVTDNSGQPVIWGSSRESGQIFSVGKHDIIMWASDQSNNSAFCNFSVIVIKEVDLVGINVIPVYVWVIVAAAVVSFVTLGVCLRRKQTYKPLDGIDREFEEYLQEHLPKAALAWNVKRTALKILNEEPIGVGEFGRVYKARLTDRGREHIVAAKTLCETRSDAFSRKNFVHEVQCLVELACHANVIPFLGIVINGEPKYILTEYACQGDLKNHLISLRLLCTETETQLIKVSRDIANALSFMSMKGVMHKDIAARNVFLTNDFTAKVGDFGLGRDVYERLGSDYLTPTWANQQCRFPLRWMPPEFLNDGTFTLESDIWSYGILLWEIASLGGSPMTDVPVANLLEYLRNGRRPVKPEGCTLRAYRIMQRCWHEDRYERPTPDQLMADFDCMLRIPANGYQRFFTEAFKERDNDRPDMDFGLE